MTSAAAALISQIARLIGPHNVLAGDDMRQACAVDEVQPSAVVRPRTSAEIADILRLCAAEGLAVIPMGGRTKLGIGMPPRKFDLAMDLTRMDRLLAFEPGDLTLGVEPGMRFADLQRRLSARKQFLPLAPCFAQRATIGGIVAAAADSVLRPAYGGVRDQLLGMEFVTGQGVFCKSGGQVVKNVTGYDLHQVLAGSLGTLAVMTRLNFRTLPIPPEQRIFVASFPTSSAALDFSRAIAQSQLQPAIAEVLSPVAARLLAGSYASCELWTVAVGAAGNMAVVRRHEKDLSRMAVESAACGFAVLDGQDRACFFEQIREFPALAQRTMQCLSMFRITALPTHLPQLIAVATETAERHGFELALAADALGIVYAALLGKPACPDVVSAACGELMAQTQGLGARPLLQWCPPQVKSKVVWPLSDSDQVLAERLKKVFDPHGVLSPGRFQGGI